MPYKLSDIKRWVAAGAKVRLKCGATVRLDRRSPTPEEFSDRGIVFAYVRGSDDWSVCYFDLGGHKPDAYDQNEVVKVFGSDKDAAWLRKFADDYQGMDAQTVRLRLRKIAKRLDEVK